MSGREEGYIPQEGGTSGTYLVEAMSLLNMCDGVSRLGSDTRQQSDTSVVHLHPPRLLNPSPAYLLPIHPFVP